MDPSLAGWGGWPPPRRIKGSRLSSLTFRCTKLSLTPASRKRIGPPNPEPRICYHSAAVSQPRRPPRPCSTGSREGFWFFAEEGDLATAGVAAGSVRVASRRDLYLDFHKEEPS